MRLIKELSEKEVDRINNEIEIRKKASVKHLLLNLKNQQQTIRDFVTDSEYFSKENLGSELGFNSCAYWLASSDTDIHFVFDRWIIDESPLVNLYNFIGKQEDIVEEVNNVNLRFINIRNSILTIRKRYLEYKEMPIKKLEPTCVSTINKLGNTIIKLFNLYLEKAEMAIKGLDRFK